MTWRRLNLFVFLTSSAFLLLVLFWEHPISRPAAIVSLTWNALAALDEFTR